MGFFSRLFGFGDDSARIAELAAEVERYADRFDNAGGRGKARSKARVKAQAKARAMAALARDYAQRIAASTSLKPAEILYAEFLAMIAKEDYEFLRHQDYDPDRYTSTRNDNEIYSDDS